MSSSAGEAIQRFTDHSGLDIQPKVAICGVYGSRLKQGRRVLLNGARGLGGRTGGGEGLVRIGSS